jgi:hypothetical protein
MTPILTCLASDIDQAIGGTECMDAIAASTADLSLVEWRFLAEVLREMVHGTVFGEALSATVIAGLDGLGRGRDWPGAEAAAAGRSKEPALSSKAIAAVMWAATAAEFVQSENGMVAYADSAAVTASLLASNAGVTFHRQRDILLRLIEEAGE